MENQEINSWDKANRQGENIDYNKDSRAERMYLKEDQAYEADDDQNEINPNIDADGYGSEAGRSPHSYFSTGVSGRSGNASDNSNVASTRSNENLSSGNSGASGRSS